MSLNKVSQLSEEQIALRLQKAYQKIVQPTFTELSYPSELISDNPKPAAVLIPLLIKEQQWHILFIRRNPGLQEHSGQVAFVGGGVEPGDLTPEDTALREAQEEIGLKPTDVRILGRIKDFLTITHYRVTPVVGVIPWPYPFNLAKEEVSRIFTIPLDWLAEPTNHEEKLHDLPPPYSPISAVHFKPYDGEILWGASARFILALIQILGDSSFD